MDKGLSCMIDTKTWCWGDADSNKLREGAHRYIKAIYVDKWDTRVTADDPYIVVLTGDLTRVNLKGSKCVTLCGAKECDHRLPSQKQSTGGHDNNINQSRNLYVPAAAGYCTESDLMPLFEQLVELFVEIEHQKYVIVDGCGIIFSAAIQHKDMVGYNEKATGAGFVRFLTEVDEYGETIIKVNAYGKSISLGIESQEGDTAIITRQITNTY